MSLTNFTPELWATMLMTDRPKETVMAKLCYTGPFLGDIKSKGDIVHIAGVGRPTIYDYTKGQTLTTEYLSDSNVDLIIDQAKYFDILLDDIDAKQAAGQIMTVQMQEARRALAETLDAYIAGLYGSACTTVTQTAVTSANVISTISDGLVALMENNIPTNEEICLVVSPKVYAKMKIADILFNTDNSKTLLGYMGSAPDFMNASVYVSNNLTVQNTTGSYCMMFTKKAIALAEQIPATSIEKFRPSTTFADAIKCLHLYGAKVIKPKELVTLALTTAAETSV